MLKILNLHRGKAKQLNQSFDGVIDGLRPRLPTIWQSFHPYEKQRDSGYPEQAYQSLFYAVELIHIGRQVYRDEFDLEELEAHRRRMEQEHEITPDSPQVFALPEKLSRSEAEEDRGYFSNTKDKDDQQLEGMARSYSRAFGLPPACFPNVLAELQSCRLFYNRAGGDLELLPYDRVGDRRELYLRPVRFVIRNKRTDIRSMPASDLAALLKIWGYEGGGSNAEG
jgi:hypothetical protein